MTPCIEYQGTRNRPSYGMLWVDGKQWVASRWAWTQANGPIPPGMMVLHRCDNPPCWNPEHLFLGTAADNMRDRDAKGRTAKGDRQGLRVHPESRPYGEKNGLSKLTRQEVEDVRVLHDYGIGATRLGRLFGVNRSTVRRAFKGQTWGHLG